jgi:O-antigen/teichoic acid export membrane protein
LVWFRWHFSPHLVRIAALGVLSLSLYQFSIFVLRGLQQFKKLAIYSSIYAVSIVLIAFFCIQWPTVELLLIATYAVQLLLLPWMWRYLSQITNMSNSERLFHLPREWHGIVRFSLVIYLTLLVDQIVWQRSEIFFLAQLPDARQTGIYSLAYTVAFVVVGIIPSAVTGVLTPVFTKVGASQGIDHLRLSYKSNFTILNWFTLPVSIALIVFSPVLISDFFGNAYHSAGSILLLLILSSTVAIYSRPGASMLHALNLPKVLLISSLCALPANLLLAWRFVPIFGAMGAAFANFIAQAIAGSIAIGYVSLRVRVNYDWIHLGQVMIAAILCGVTAWLIMSIIPIPLLRLLVASLVGFVVYLITLLIMKDEIAARVLKKSLGMVQTCLAQLSPES